MYKRNIDEAIAEARRQYNNEWRRNHKEKVAQYNRNYWLKKANEKQKEVKDNELTKNENSTTSNKRA